MYCQVTTTTKTLDQIKLFKFEEVKQNDDLSFHGRTIFHSISEARGFLAHLSYNLYESAKERKANLKKNSLHFKGVELKIELY